MKALLIKPQILSFKCFRISDTSAFTLLITAFSVQLQKFPPKDGQSVSNCFRIGARRSRANFSRTLHEVGAWDEALFCGHKPWMVQGAALMFCLGNNTRLWTEWEFRNQRKREREKSEIGRSTKSPSESIRKQRLHRNRRALIMMGQNCSSSVAETICGRRELVRYLWHFVEVLQKPSLVLRAKT